MAEKKRLRFAPSNTGLLHMGGARTALYNWLVARQSGGTFILRIEDTDRERSKEEYLEDIYGSLRWLGLDWDEGPEKGGDKGPYFQSERGDLYRPFIEKILAKGAETKNARGAYRCFCTRERLDEVRAVAEREKRAFRGYDRLCRSIDPAEAVKRAEAGEAHVVRIAVPEGEETAWDDMIKGRVAWKNAEIDDLILLRADGSPTYNFVATIDDILMEITDVVRGDDHTSNTPKQILITQALDLTPPRFGHIPLIFGPDGKKLSKRNPDIPANVSFYREAGYPAAAFVNFLALLGWAYDDKTEIFSREDLLEKFDLGAVSKSGAVIDKDLNKLKHFAGVWIRERLELDDIVAGMTPFLVSAGLIARSDVDAQRDRLRLLAGAFRERLTGFAEIAEKSAWAFRAPAECEPKAEKNLLKNAEAPEWLRKYADVLEGAGDTDATRLEEQARALCEEWGAKFGHFVAPVRAALTGQVAGPPLFDVILLIGISESSRRLRAGADLAEKKQAEKAS